MTLNQLGLHILEHYGGSLGQPTVCKLVDASLEEARRVRALLPAQTLLVIRWHEEQQPLDVPETRAREWFAKRIGYMRQVGGYTAYEAYNEVGDGQTAAYARFELERLRLLHSAGLRGCYLNASVGTPHEDLWPLWRPLLQAFQPGDVCGLHGYWTDRADIQNAWHTARWSLPDVEPYLRGIPIVVTECGRDYTPDTKQGQAGWQRTCNADEFLQDLREYAALLERFPQVIGATVYTAGRIIDPQWQPFSVDSLWPRVVSEYGPLKVTPPPAKEDTTKMGIDGRLLNAEQFRAHVQATDLSWARRVVMHHTAIPTKAQWAQAGWEKRKANMWAYYHDTLGWDAGPHLFISDEGIGLFWPLNRPGIGVVGHNADTIHIEVVGDYSKEMPTGPTLVYAILTAAVLLDKLGTGIDGLTYHRALQPGTACPGELWVNRWSWFAGLVRGRLQPPEAAAMTIVEQVLGEEIQKYIIPLNPNAALEKAAANQGLLSASGEQRREVNGVVYVYQAFRHPGKREWQYIGYCKDGDWGNVSFFERKN